MASLVLDLPALLPDSSKMTAQPQKPESLQIQLERTRFERAQEICESLAERRALLTTTELARINSILTGKNNEPWREETTTVTLPSGKTETISVMTNPTLIAREKLHRATELAETGNAIDAAVEIYVDLVLAHVFKDANRRCAVLAAHYFLHRYGIKVSGLAIHELGLGDLREEGQIEILRDTIRQMARFTERK
jgi:prophage maintenance system killer protein